MDFNEEKRTPLISRNPEEIKELYKQGLLTLPDVQLYGARKRLAKNGLLDLDVADVKTLGSRQYISEDDIKEYAFAKKHPFLYGMKEGGLSIIKGGAKAVKETHVTLNELFYGAFREDETIRKEVETAWSTLIPDAVENSLGKESHLKSAKAVESITQFTTGMIGTGKLLKVNNIAKTIQNGKLLSTLNTKAPKLASWLSRIGAESIVGAGVDYAVFDPKEGNRLADVLSENTSLKNPVIEYLKTNPKNTSQEERLKQVLEGALVGAGFSSVLDLTLGSLKAVKKAFFFRAGNDATEVNRMIDNALVKEGKTEALQDAAEKNSPTEVLKTPEEIEAESAYGDKIITFFDKQRKGKEGELQDMLAKEVEKPENIYNLFRHIQEISDEKLQATIRGVQPDKKVLSSAVKRFNKLTGGDGGEETLLQEARGIFKQTRFLGEKIKLINQIVNAQHSRLNKMVNQPNLNLDQKFAILEAMDNLVETSYIMKGVRAEMGRGFRHSGFKDVLKVDSKRLENGKALKDAFLESEDTKGAENAIDSLIESFKNAKTEEAKFFVAKAGMSKTEHSLRSILEFVQANLLWGGATHAANMMSGALMYSFESLKKLSGSFMYAGKKGNPKELLETVAWLHGAKQGLYESFKLPGVTAKNFFNPPCIKKGIKRTWNMDTEAGNVWKALFSSQSQIDTLGSKIDSGLQAFNPKDYNKLKQCLGKESRIGVDAKGWVQAIGTLLKLPFHGLAATDELIKNIAYYSEIHSKVWRETVENVDVSSTKEAAKVYLNRLKASASEELNYQGIMRAREVTFTHDAGSFMKKLDNIANDNFGLGFRIFMMPFYKIPLNIMRCAGKNSPLAWFSSQFWKNLKKGEEEAYEALAGTLGGSAVMALGYSLYEDGKITGRTPKDIRETVQAFGTGAYNFKIGEDLWVDYSKLDPGALLLGLGADFGRAYDTFQYTDPETKLFIDNRFEKVSGALLAMFGEPLMNKTLLQSLGDTVKLLSSPEQMNKERYFARQGVKFVPMYTLFSNIQREAFDEFIRTKETALDEIYSLFYLKGVPIKRHPLYGTPLEQHEKVFQLRATEETKDPVLKEVMRLGMPLRDSSEYLSQSGIRIPLNREQWAEYHNILIKLPMKEVLHKIVKSKEYQALPSDELKMKLLKNQITAFRRQAKEILFGTNKEMQEQFFKRINHKVKAYQGNANDQNLNALIQRYLP